MPDLSGLPIVSCSTRVPAWSRLNYNLTILKRQSRLYVMRKKTATLLREALIEGGQMAYTLYEYELEEHIDYWYKGLKADRDDFVFAVTENSGHVAMVLIMPDKTVFVNEAARAKLAEFWQNNYIPNMKRLIPLIVQDLADDAIFVNGVKVVPTQSPRRIWGKAPKEAPRRIWGKART
jgi:hypothetical protein